MGQWAKGDSGRAKWRSGVVTGVTRLAASLVTCLGRWRAQPRCAKDARQGRLSYRSPWGMPRSCSTVKTGPSLQT